MTLLKTTDGCTYLSQCQLAKPSNFHIGSELPKVLFKMLFWALLLAKALFWALLLAKALFFRTFLGTFKSPHTFIRTIFCPFFCTFLVALFGHFYCKYTLLDTLVPQLFEREMRIPLFCLKNQFNTF